MREADRLRDLQMGEARHDGVDVRFGKIEQRALQRPDQRQQSVDLVAQIQPHIGRHLVVARTAGVQAFAGVADQRGQPLLDIQVHVFQVQRPDEFAADDLVLDLRRARA